MCTIECLLIGGLSGSMMSYTAAVVALYVGGTRHRAMPRITASAVLVAAGLLAALALVSVG
jgi:hypothetical protein